MWANIQGFPIIFPFDFFFIFSTQHRRISSSERLKSHDIRWCHSRENDIPTLKMLQVSPIAFITSMFHHRIKSRLNHIIWVMNTPNFMLIQILENTENPQNTSELHSFIHPVDSKWRCRPTIWFDIRTSHVTVHCQSGRFIDYFH